MNVSAIIVTRGNVDVDTIVYALKDVPSIREILVWDNRDRDLTRWRYDEGGWPVDLVAFDLPNLAVYGRYAAIEHAFYDLIYVQDDDCVVENAETLVEEWQDECFFRCTQPATEDEPNNFLVANMPAARWPEFPDWSLVGWGACFHRDLPAKAFFGFGDSQVVRDAEVWPSAFFNRECDAVFTTLTPHVKVDVGFRHLPWAEGPGRMFTEDPERHRQERQRMVELARKVRDAV